MPFRNKFFSYGLPEKNKRLVGDAPTVIYSEKDFWRGVFDGNGSIGFTSDNEPFISIVMTSENLKNTFCELLAEKFDIRKTVNPNKRDHVYNIIHLLINCSPQHYIPDMIKALKGVSARLLMKEFGEELKRKLWGGNLWNPSYFVATVSENTEEQIRKYIKNQKRK